MNVENKSLQLIHEIIIDIVIQGVPSGSVSCTPQDLECLAAGWMLTEGRIRSARQIGRIDAHPEEGRLDIELIDEPHAPGEPEGTEFGPDEIEWTQEELRDVYREFAVDPPLWKATGAAHSCLIVRHGEGDGTLEFLYRSEDAGRHSTLDKAIGWALLNHVDLHDCLLMTSGRISTRMAEKARRAGASGLAGKGTVTAEAVEIARDAKMTLFGFVKANRAVCFTK